MLPLRWMPPGAPIALALFTLGLVGAISGGCSPDPGVGATDPDASTGAEPLGSGICPEAAPDARAPCLLPEGTTCAFGACGTPIARCERGVWVYGGTPPPRPPCPALFPTADTACPPCWPVALTCTYGTCFGPDASANTTVASCPSGTWRLDYFACEDEDGEGDGGAPADAADAAEGDAGDAGEPDAEAGAHVPRDSGTDEGY